MLEIAPTSRFKKDIKKCRKRGKDMEKIKEVINILAIEKKLPFRCFDHFLTGDYNHCRECHIEPDWLLIYRVADGCLSLIRTGTHSDLFV